MPPTLVPPAVPPPPTAGAPPSLAAIQKRHAAASGRHAQSAAVLAAAVWPLLGWPARCALLAFIAGVGWSRIALGAHFPADVLAGFALGWACVVAASPLARCVDGGFSVPGQKR